jgi:hypothetical protein
MRADDAIVNDTMDVHMCPDNRDVLRSLYILAIYSIDLLEYSKFVFHLYKNWLLKNYSICVFDLLSYSMQLIFLI